MNKKLIIATFLIATAFFIGLFVSLERKYRPTDPPTNIGAIKEPVKVALTPQQVSRFFSDCGITGSEHAKVRDLLLNETPQTIDLSTTNLKETVEDHMLCLTQEEMVNSLKAGERSLNKMLINKASRNVAKEKSTETFVNDN